VFCVVTAAVFHASGDQLIDFLKNLAMAGGLLQIVAFGAGAWSLDAVLGPAAQVGLQSVNASRP